MRGVVRFSSSARITLPKIGPGRKRSSPTAASKIATPSTSAGSRSDVNWMRRNVRSSDRASARASVVLPVPGTSSMSA